ncbi:MAG: hypothetical protein P8N76_18975 [Pirellulaceae bacterium]|nr:hypothetical protein [Pirellulaceae bacterium]
MTEPLTAETLRIGASLFEAGCFDEALHLLHDQLEVDPNEGRLWELYGLVFRATNDCLACLDALERASLYVPLSFLAQCALAECYVNTGRYELARDIYIYLVEQPDLSTALLKRLVAGFDGLGDLPMALRLSREVAKQLPNDAESRYAVAYFMAKLDYPLPAIESEARHAVALAPGNVQYRIGLAGLLEQHGRVLEALEWITDLSVEQIRNLSCKNCLVRLARIFDTAEDESQATICRRMLAGHRETNATDDRQNG